jgi:hypothetical protein
VSKITEPAVLWTPVRHPGVTIPSRLSWDSACPLEVTVTFTEAGVFGTADTIRWVFGRDLITEASAGGKAGLGDVQVEVTHGMLLLLLTSPFGAIELSTEAALVLAFVQRTLREVDEDDEAGRLPLTDDELEDTVQQWGRYMQ